MTINWNAQKITYGTVTQVKFSVIDNNKTIGIHGSIEGNPEDSDLVQWVKDFIGSNAVAEYEREAQEIEEALPEFPFPIEQEL